MRTFSCFAPRRVKACRSVMMRRWRCLPTVFLVLMACMQAVGQTADPLRTAREQGRPALIYFCGSDWCANCKAFGRDVLSKPEVQAAMAEGFVVYTADRPVRHPLDADTERLNASLVERYNAANIFPLVVVVGPDGQVLDRIGYDRGLPPGRYAERLRKWSAPTP